MTLDEYLALITSEHTGKPKFEATVAAGVGPLAKVQAVLKNLITELDIDSAIGVQLDKIGEWVGFSRVIKVQLSGVYFSFDSLEQDGWESGVWKDRFDPDTGPMLLNDDQYRSLLKAKVAVNNWDGTVGRAYDVWSEAFGDSSYIIIQDNQDMSMLLAVAGKLLSVVEKTLLLESGLLMKPEGVRISDLVFTRTESPLFCFDTDSEKLKGWESGNWSESYFDLGV